MSIPSPQELSRLSESEIKDVLNTLFEPCETLTNYLISNLFNSNQIYSSYRQIIENSRSLLEQLRFSYLQNKTNEELKFTIDKIISAHPRLGPPKPTTATSSNEELSSHSKSEQASLNSNSDPKLTQRLVELNDLYETTFPGLRFVVFVNGRSRELIMDDMVVRIDRNDLELEIKAAFDAMCDIALDRARKLGARL